MMKSVRIRNVVFLAVVLSFAFTSHVAFRIALLTMCPPPPIASIPYVEKRISPIASIKVGYDQSFGFFDDIDDEVWKRYQAKARYSGKRNHATDPLLYWNNASPARLWYSLNYEPLFTCPHVVRIGGVGDGPKWTCDPHRIKKVAARRGRDGKNTSNCLVYSIGSEGRYSFEDNLVELMGPDVCEIHVFDPGNYSRPQNDRLNIHYHNWGLKSSYDTSQPLYGGTFVSFPEILRKLGHENRTIDILKVDCEWCEWYSYKDWIKYGDVRQLMIETHRLPYFETTNLWTQKGIELKPTQLFDDLQDANFILFSKEPNIQGEVSTISC
jgi:hypothetical protein